MIQLFPDTAKLGMRAIGKRRPQVWQQFLALAHEVLQVDSALSQVDRELIGAYLSMKFGCDFCHLRHLDTAEALGGKSVRHLVDNPTEELKILFDFADEVVNNKVTDTEIQHVLDAGYSEQAIEDVIFVASLFGFANRMVTGFGIHYVQERDQRRGNKN